MKNYFKKFSIMFVMLLAVMGIGAIQQGTVANAATVGQQLTQPESGWKRFDDKDSNILYSGIKWKTWTDLNSYSAGGHTVDYSTDGSEFALFKFYGTKVRLISYRWTGNYTFNIYIDDELINNSVPISGGSSQNQTLVFDLEKLNLGFHTVKIVAKPNNGINVDAIDINQDGYLVNPNESIALDKSSMNLTVNDSQQLTATTTPASVGVKWTSSDESIATVDSTGKVTGVKEGQATITAATANGLTATCTVNVTKKDESISLNKSITNLTTGDSETLIATTTPSAVNVTWSSSDTSVATVDSNGKVTAIGVGTATITATTADGSNLSASCTINVKANNGGNTGGTTTPTNPTDTNGGTSTGTDGASTIVNIAHAKGDNTNNPGGVVTILFHETADTTLSVVKTADVKDVWVGDTFTYTIVVTNTGTKTAKAVVVNDPAPNHIDFVVNGVTTTQGTVDSSSTSKNIIVNVGDIPPSGTVTIKVPATVII